jgi:RNA polymerase sigma factor (sigma-70 family)
MDDRTDANLMGLYQQGDKAAFDEIYARYSDRLLGFIKMTLRSRAPYLLDSAVDIRQDIFLRLHREREKFIGGSKIWNWLLRRATRDVANLIKYNNRQKRDSRRTLPLSLNSRNEVDAQSFLGLDKTSPDYDQLVHELTQRVLTELTPRQRQTVELVFLERLTDQDAATRLNLSKLTIARHKTAALARIRQHGALVQ